MNAPAVKFKDYVGDQEYRKISAWIRTPTLITKQAKKPKSFRKFYMAVSRALYTGNIAYPHHLQPLIDSILGKNNAKIITAVPRRHSKTTTILACFAYICFREQRTKQIFATYSDELATEASTQFEAICRAWLVYCGIDPDTIKARAFGNIDKREVRGNIVYFVSLKGACTGKGANRNIVVDDPLKGKSEADSQQIRDTVYDNITSAVFSGAEFKEVNKIICGTRWHIDDPQGRFKGRKGWVFVSLPAITHEKGQPPASGKALWPEVRPMDFLLDQMEDMGGEFSYAWTSLFQGEPPADQFQVFSNRVRRVRELGPDWESKIVETAYGIDLAYTDTRHSDNSAFFCVHRLSTGEYVLGKDYLLDKYNTLAFFEKVKTKTTTVYWYGSAGEIDRSEEIYMTHQLVVNGRRSHGKLWNVQHFSRYWNEGRVFVPDEWRESSAEGVALPIPQIRAFTGDPGGKDDALDAITAAFDVVAHREGEMSTGMGRLTV